jgi:hypothetical protein
MRWIGVASFGVLVFASMPARAELLVNISKSQQQLSVIVDGEQAFRWPVSTGRRGYDTPQGSFRPIRLERDWYSRKYDLSPMPWSVFFYRGYAVHGTLETANLGHAASHGCVRLRPENAAVLYSLVRVHGFGKTRIVIMNGKLPAVPGAAPSAENNTAVPLEVAGAPPGEKPAELAFAKASREPPLRASDGRGSDEASVLRSREAWLRSLDRKYGIVR